MLGVVFFTGAMLGGCIYWRGLVAAQRVVPSGDTKSETHVNPADTLHRRVEPTQEQLHMEEALTIVGRWDKRAWHIAAQDFGLSWYDLNEEEQEDFKQFVVHEIQQYGDVEVQQGPTNKPQARQARRKIGRQSESGRL